MQLNLNKAGEIVRFLLVFMVILLFSCIAYSKSINMIVIYTLPYNRGSNFDELLSYLSEFLDYISKETINISLVFSHQFIIRLAKDAGKSHKVQKLLEKIDKLLKSAKLEIIIDGDFSNLTFKCIKSNINLSIKYYKAIFKVYPPGFYILEAEKNILDYLSSCGISYVICRKDRFIFKNKPYFPSAYYLKCKDNDIVIFLQDEYFFSKSGPSLISEKFEKELDERIIKLGGKSSGSIPVCPVIAVNLITLKNKLKGNWKKFLNAFCKYILNTEKVSLIKPLDYLSNYIELPYITMKKLKICTKIKKLNFNRVKKPILIIPSVKIIFNIHSAAELKAKFRYITNTMKVYVNFKENTLKPVLMKRIRDNLYFCKIKGDFYKGYKLEYCFKVYDSFTKKEYRYPGAYSWFSVLFIKPEENHKIYDAQVYLKNNNVELSFYIDKNAVVRGLLFNNSSNKILSLFKKVFYCGYHKFDISLKDKFANYTLRLTSFNLTNQFKRDIEIKFNYSNLRKKAKQRVLLVELNDKEKVDNYLKKLKDLIEKNIKFSVVFSSDFLDFLVLSKDKHELIEFIRKYVANNTIEIIGKSYFEKVDIPLYKFYSFLVYKLLIQSLFNAQPRYYLLKSEDDIVNCIEIIEKIDKNKGFILYDIDKNMRLIGNRNKISLPLYSFKKVFTNEVNEYLVGMQKYIQSHFPEDKLEFAWENEKRKGFYSGLFKYIYMIQKKLITTDKIFNYSCIAKMMRLITRLYFLDKVMNIPIVRKVILCLLDLTYKCYFFENVDLLPDDFIDISLHTQSLYFNLKDAQPFLWIDTEDGEVLSGVSPLIKNWFSDEVIIKDKKYSVPDTVIFDLNSQFVYFLKENLEIVRKLELVDKKNILVEYFFLNKSESEKEVYLDINIYLIPSLLSGLYDGVYNINNNLAKREILDRKINKRIKLEFVNSNPVSLKSVKYFAGVLYTFRYKLKLLPLKSQNIKLQIESK